MSGCRLGGEAARYVAPVSSHGGITFEEHRQHQVRFTRADAGATAHGAALRRPRPPPMRPAREGVLSKSQAIKLSEGRA